MRVVFKHDGDLPVERYGGTERILWWHMKELVRQNHTVILVGRGRFRLEGTGIQRAETIPKDADILHLHCNERSELPLPTVFTCHGNGQPGEEFSENTVFLTRNHAENHGAEFFINNALDLREYPFESRNDDDWDSFLFLAKASWRVKNLSHCVRACRKAGKRLHVAGGRSLWPSRWIKNHGMIDTAEVRGLAGNTRALLFPVRWHEPFGLAVIEAMSQGLPVIGSSYGSLPELIADGCGVVCRNYEEFFGAVSERPGRFDSRHIRRVVEERYSIEAHTRAFVRAYERVLAGEKLNSKRPATVSGIPPETLLPF